MEVRFHKDFKKEFGKLSPKIQQKFWERLELWQEQPSHPLLKHHVLSGKLEGKHSINVSGDIRAIYEELDIVIVVYLMIGTHSQLYG
ncbi:MAG TPA: type II toxin-antitoxin system mRNA interferase toxin, RelE/StbE family [Patescibacteria group bacterium]|jgi:addiction module RelE/StbE family toxin|nr:type II toxin-antitoxin system mRNA interferase toxin, RelE/StbE family [Patescibacteria group bacterium]